jgi:hypothetical protein
VPKGAPPAAAATVSREELKALWKRGAEAKHAGKLKEAERLWKEGLAKAKAQPGFEASAKGFEGSLADLHKR